MGFLWSFYDRARLEPGVPRGRARLLSAKGSLQVCKSHFPSEICGLANASSENLVSKKRLPQDHVCECVRTWVCAQQDERFARGAVDITDA